MRRDCQTEYISIGGDTETCDGDANTYQLAYSPDVGEVHFVNPETIEKSFLSELDNVPATRDRAYVVWFHNIAFDLPVLFPKRHNLFREEEFDFDSEGWNISGVYSHIVFCTLRKKRKCVHLYGTDSYFKTSLDSLAKIFCPALPKLETPKGIGERFFTDQDDEFVKYAERDSLITFAVGSRIVEMHKRFDIPLSVSAPHMASRVFRKKFLKVAIPIPPMPLVYAALHSYHGGKNNFPVERGLYTNVKCVDIKSAYPFAMASLPAFSNRDLYYKSEFDVASKQFPSFGVYKISGIAHITPWPIVYDAAFKPIIGTFKDIWITGFELNRGIESELITITKCFGYYYDAESDNNASPFAEYVKHFYELKETAADKGERNFYKLLLNSLYGKLIETRGGSSLMNLRYDIDKDEHEQSLSLIAGTMFNPFIATLITGHTRAYIHALECKHRSIHTSTDGIMTQDTTIDGLSDDLGGLSIEAEGDALILRNKLYAVYCLQKDRAATDKDGKPLASILYPKKFIRKYALHGFFANIQTLEHMIKNDIKEYEYVKVNKLRESLRRNLKVNRFEKRQRKLNLE